MCDKTSVVGPRMKTLRALDDLLNSLARNAALPDELAEATPPQIYTSPDFLELELDEIFNRDGSALGAKTNLKTPEIIGQLRSVVTQSSFYETARVFSGRCQTYAVTECRRCLMVRAT